MTFCRKPKKKSPLVTPLKGMILLLAAIGGYATVCELRKRGETAKHALGRAGCRCKDAARDAAAEILKCSDE